MAPNFVSCVRAKGPQTPISNGPTYLGEGDPVVEKIDHIGVLVSDLATQCALYEEFGMSVGTVETVDEFDVEIAFLPVGESLVELIEPVDPDSGLAADLETAPGEAFLHHVAYRVPDIDKRLAELKAKGIPLADEEPRPGGAGARIAFLDDSAFGGVAIELIERESDLTFD